MTRRLTRRQKAVLAQMLEGHRLRLFRTTKGKTFWALTREVRSAMTGQVAEGVQRVSAIVVGRLQAKRCVTLQRVLLESEAHLTEAGRLALAAPPPKAPKSVQNETKPLREQLALLD